MTKIPRVLYPETCQNRSGHSAQRWWETWTSPIGYSVREIYKTTFNGPTLVETIGKYLSHLKGTKSAQFFIARKKRGPRSLVFLTPLLPSLLLLTEISTSFGPTRLPFDSPFTFDLVYLKVISGILSFFFVFLYTKNGCLRVRFCLCLADSVEE